MTVFQNHFHNIFLKSFGLLLNLMRNSEILHELMRFHKANDISQNFIGITLDFHEIAKYFVDFWFRFWYLQKMTAKFWFLSNRFEISKFRNF